ncbi:MAG: hypothetical protein K5790_04175 [Nitrosopumilus sp.]|uniref:hypothetical protein n=1 Tax=Nitrosopumilus sp. TaxID=2024843 RepID=UPI00247ED43A|nr:hypothetical protein [Nitrosopumilus sp.]MCV0392475.1 hypothetical protein [Nitrosopumilus sp.]
MNKLILIPVILGIAAVLSLSLMLISEDTNPTPLTDEGFTFYDAEKIKTKLGMQNITMSSPTAITDHTKDQYCTYFDSNDVQKFVEYCTTTAIVNSDGDSIGNINMGGTINGGPIMAVALIESSPFLDSSKDEVDAIFEAMIETLVCDCWAEKQPGNFETVQEWINAAERHFAESDQSSSLKSEISGLAQKKIILEVSATGDAYLWTLIVLK